ncbi:Uncharacterised protein [Mycobacteroides abscessus subsp. abscessus]|nr:Uncharacterised protein [Mycobacteroides abscessus subsp. abscessus]
MRNRLIKAVLAQVQAVGPPFMKILGACTSGGKIGLLATEMNDG